MIEYVLLLVVIVGLILASAKIFKTIDQGMQKYIGDYFVCLMEYGELPTLGVSDQDLKKHVGGQGRKCDNQFDAFTFENGRPATAGGGTSNGNNGNSSQNGNGRNGSASDNGRGGNTGDSSANRDRKESGSGGDDTGDGSDLMARGRSGSGSSSRRPEVRRAEKSYATLDGGANEQSNIKVIEEDGDGDDSKERSKRRRPKKTQIGYADKYRAIGGKALQEIERTQRRRATVRKPTSTVLKINADEGLSGPYRKTVTPPERKPDAEIKDKESGFGFGAFFKWLLIAGMVVAIIVFFGGQLLNYSNSE